MDELSTLPWRKASASSMHQCVEVAWRLEILVRNSKKSDGAVVAFTEAEWAAFIEGVKKGEFDVSARAQG